MPAKHLKTHTSLILVAHGTFVGMERALAEGADLEVAPQGTELPTTGQYSHHE